MWNVIDEQDDKSLPQADYGYFLVTLEYYESGSRRTVDKSFYTKDREFAKQTHGLYSRKHQGKQSVHFRAASTSYRVIAWMEIPETYGDRL